MEFLLWFIAWYLFGFVTSLFVLWKVNDRITIGDIAAATYCSVLGPIATLIILAIEYSHVTLFRKKRR